MRNTIMTEKIARRGVRVPTEYAADYLEQVLVRDACARDVVSLRTKDALGDVRRWMQSGRVEAQHQGYPVVDDSGRVRGLVTRRVLLDPSEPGNRRIGDLPLRPPMVVHEHHSLREAADHMVAENVGRLIVVGVDAPHPLVGILTRGDILSAHARRLKEAHESRRHIRWRASSRRAAKAER
jgi:predicted transcriptional regulator